MHDVMEFVLPLVTALIAIFPLAILITTYRRTGRIRILIAALAFAGFTIKGVILFSGFFLDALDPARFEIVEFASDFSIISLFAASFLWKSRADHDGSA